MRPTLCVLMLVAAPALADESFAVQTVMRKARLDRASAEKVQVIVESFRPKMDVLRRQDHELVRSLRAQLSVNKADERAMARLSDQLLGNRAKLRELRSDRLTAIKKALPTPAFARLLLAMPRIDRAVYRHAIEQQRGSDS